MVIKRILLLAGSGFAQHVTSQGAQKISAREFFNFDAFCSELTSLLTVPIVVMDGEVRIDDDDLLIVTPEALDKLLACSHESRGLARRCLVMGTTRNMALTQAESLGLAGVVDSAVYSQWKIDYPHAEVALFGLREALLQMAGNLSPLSKEAGAHYQRITAPAGARLPAFVVEYIHALQEIGFLTSGAHPGQ